jgi:hypothetical protein
MVIMWTLVNNRYLVHMDISAAFLNGKMDVDLYLRMPKGTHSPFGSNGIWKALSSIYGTKQAPYLWSETLREELVRKGYTQCKGDPCLWYLEEEEGHISILVCIWVDDFAVSVPNLASEQRFSKDISRFQHKVLGKVNCLLGVHYSWDSVNRRVFMSQQPHIEDMLKRYRQEEGPNVDLPCPAEWKLSKADLSDLDPATNLKLTTWVQGVVGNGRWCERLTRMELRYVIHELSKVQVNPGPRVVKGCEHLLGYLRSTKTHGLVFDAWGLKPGEFPLSGSSDSSWAEELDARRSLGCCLMMVGNNVIMHQCKLTSIVCHSSFESELLALVTMLKMLMWMGSLISEVGVDSWEHPLLIKEDNQASIEWSKMDKPSARSKHIDIKNHAIKEAVREGLVKLQYCNTDDMVADVMTKALDKTKLFKFRANMGIVARTDFDAGAQYCREVMGWK